MQLNHYNSKFKPREFPICIICDGVNSPYNMGGVFRIADAFGVKKVILINSVDTLSTKIKKTSRSAEKYVDYEISQNFEEVYNQLSAEKYQFLALEITQNSTPLHTLSIDPKSPIALIIGGENSGISDPILDQVSRHIHIDMYGVNSSMNVVQSAAIALYELTSHLK